MGRCSNGQLAMSDVTETSEKYQGLVDHGLDNGFE